MVEGKPRNDGKELLFQIILTNQTKRKIVLIDGNLHKSVQNKGGVAIICSEEVKWKTLSSVIFFPVTDFPRLNLSIEPGEDSLFLELPLVKNSNNEHSLKFHMRKYFLISLIKERKYFFHVLFHIRDLIEDSSLWSGSSCSNMFTIDPSKLY